MEEATIKELEQKLAKEKDEAEHAARKMENARLEAEKAELENRRLEAEAAAKAE